MGRSTSLGTTRSGVVVPNDPVVLFCFDCFFLRWVVVFVQKVAGVRGGFVGKLEFRKNIERSVSQAVF